MYKAFHIVAALALMTAGVSAAQAADNSQGNAVERGAAATGNAIKSGAEATGHAIESGAEATGHAIKAGTLATTNAIGLTESDRAYYKEHARGREQLSGTVANVDHATGNLSLVSDNATYRLHFPPKSLKGVNKGDPLVVSSAFAMPKGSQKAQAPLRGEHWTSATVTDVDTSNGLVDVTTEQGPLKVKFSPDAVHQLQDGDTIAINLGFREQAPQATSMR